MHKHESVLRFAVENPDENFPKTIGYMIKLVRFFSHYDFMIHSPFWIEKEIGFISDAKDMKRVADIFDFFPQYSFIIWNNGKTYPSIYRYHNKNLTVLKSEESFRETIPGVLGIYNFGLLNSLQIKNEFTANLYDELITKKPSWGEVGKYFKEERVTHAEFENFTEKHKNLIQQIFARYLP